MFSRAAKTIITPAADFLPLSVADCGENDCESVEPDKGSSDAARVTSLTGKNESRVFTSQTGKSMSNDPENHTNEGEGVTVNEPAEVTYDVKLSRVTSEGGSMVYDPNEVANIGMLHRVTCDEAGGRPSMRSPAASVRESLKNLLENIEANKVIQDCKK